MPTSAEPTRYAVDTSVAVAALDATHGAHGISRDIVRELRPALSGHAAFETYSVLTRIPGPISVDGPTAAEIIDRVFPETVWLSATASGDLRGRLGAAGLLGGAVYDALVGEAARTNGRTLLTRDRRAINTYRSLGIEFLLVDG